MNKAIKYIVTAKSSDGKKMVACYDPVFDSLMLSNSKKKDWVLFDDFENAKWHINAYGSFQRGLRDFKVEEYYV